MWRLEDSLGESALDYLGLGLGDPAQVIRPSLSHLSGHKGAVLTGYP